MPTIYGIDPGDLLHVTGGRGGEPATLPDPHAAGPDDITVELPRITPLSPRPRPPSQPPRPNR